MDKNNITSVKIPAGAFCGHNCSDGCIYWNPYDRDSNGRQYCSHYDTYYYPRERQGQEAHTAIEACGGTAQGQSIMAKLNTKMGIGMKTLTDRSTRNLAEMLSEGSSQGVMDCIKSQKDYPDAAPGSKRLMQKLQDLEEENRLKLEQFL